MAVDFLGALNAGSDIDSKNLVESLVAAERAPKESALNSKIDKAELQISAHGTVLAALGSLSSAFAALNDVDDFKDYTVNVNGALAADGSPAYSVSASTEISPGITEVSVTSIATRDRWVSDQGFESAATAINGGSAFAVSITLNGVTTAIDIDNTSPQGVVDAINSAGIGVEASLVDTGADADPFKILLAGPLGADNSFTVSSTASTGNLLSITTRTSTASDAQLTVNGLSVERSTNTISDLVAGATLTLAAPTFSTSSISVEQNKTDVELRIRALVDAYNTVEVLFDDLANSQSTTEQGGVFSGDSSFRLIKDTIKRLFTDRSSTATSDVSYLNDIGIRLDRTGALEINEGQLKAALNDNFEDIVTIFSANTNNQSSFGEASRGIAGDAIVKIENMMASDGAILSQTRMLEARVKDYAEALDDLDRRMTQLQERYLTQFTAMETAIDEMNNLRDYLSSQLDSLPFTNKK